MSSATMREPTGPAEPKDSSTFAESLQLVLDSADFRRSGRLCEFLRFVGGKAVEGVQHVSEQEIGVGVFGRSPDYDTNLDNIVRVTASQLRKRLEHFFQSEGAGQSMVIDIPRGSYLPVLRGRFSEGAALAQVPAEPSLDTRQETSTVEMPMVGLPRASIFLLGLVLILLGSTAFLFIQNRRLRLNPDALNVHSARGSLWANFIEGPRPTDLLLADASFGLLQIMVGHSIPLKEYASHRYLDTLGPPGLNPQRRADLQRVAQSSYGSFAEFHFADSLMALAPDHPALHIESARSFSLSDLTTHNLILVGSEASNPWVSLFANQLDFRLHADLASGGIFVENVHPHPGEPARYDIASDPNVYMGYCVIAFLRSSSRGPSVLLLGGTGSEETEAGGDFLLSNRDMAMLASRFGTPTLPSFDLLLRTSKLYGAPLRAEVIAARRL